MSIFSKFSIFKTPEHRKFDPIPRFYDPEKEYVENKLKKHEKTKDDKYRKIKNNIRDNYRNNRSGFGINRSIRRQNRTSNIRLIVILIALLIISYFFLTRYAINLDSFFK